MTSHRLLALAALLAATAQHAAAQTEPNLLVNHLGRLLDGTDTPVVGAVHLKFALYSNERKQTGETVFWTAEYDAVATDGLYSLMLGDTEDGKPALHPSHFPPGEQRWLGITIGTAIAEMEPRLRIGVVPLAGRALTSDDVNCTSCIDIDKVDVDSLATEFARAGDYAKLTSGGGTAQTGGLNISGTISAGGLTSTGPVTATTITASGTVTSAGLTSSGPVTATTINASGNIHAASLNADGLVFAGGVQTTAAITGSIFNGSGEGLTDVPAAAITGVLGASHLDLSGIVTPEATTCATGKFISKVNTDGTFECTDVFAGGAADADGDGIIDAFDPDKNNNGVLDALQPAVDAVGVSALAVRDGSTTADLTYQYSPLTGGSIKANWDAGAGASYVVYIGTGTGGFDARAPAVFSGTSATLSMASLAGAWTNTTYYVTVVARNASGIAIQKGTSNGVQIAEAVSWDGSTAGLRRDDKGGFTGNWPPGTGWTQVWGAHYFETVNVPSAASVRVQPFGKEDSVGAGVAASDPAVVNPRDGWLGIYANTVEIAGTVDAMGRGYGGGGGSSDVCIGNGFGGLGGSGGLSGNGGTVFHESHYGAGGIGGAGGGGGGANSRGGDGLYGGGGGSGGNCANGTVGGAARPDGTGGGAANCAMYTPVGGNGGSNADGVAGGTGRVSAAAGGGGGYGAGGGGGGWGCGSGGGGGGSGGGNGSAPSGGIGAGPFGGAVVSGTTGGNRGGYAAVGANGDTTTDRSWRLGSGGSAGGSNASHGSGGGGAGGGAIIIIGDTVTIRAAAKLKADGGAGGGGANDSGNPGGGGGGAGGGILIEGRVSLSLESGALLRTQGGTAGGNSSGAGGSVNSTTNGGTVKIFHKTGGLNNQGATITAGRSQFFPQ